MAAPVHAPVPGSGTPTNTAKACQFIRAPVVSFSFFSNTGVTFSINQGTFFNNIKINGTGTKFPTQASAKVCAGGIPIQSPTGTPPRSSTTGNADITIRMTQSGQPVLARTAFARR
eukprot:evm.model.NODE_19947_length_27331_cov_47.918774.1